MVVLPITSREKGIPFHVPVDNPGSGLKMQSFIKCEDIRSVSKERLLSYLGRVPPAVVAAVEDRIQLAIERLSRRVYDLPRQTRQPSPGLPQASVLLVQ